MQDVRETLPVGSLVRDRYLIEKVLGRGGSSAVYLVKDLRVRQNLFALKEIVDPERRERKRFAFEADLLKRVDHFSLPRVYRVFEDEAHDRSYILMDYIEGPNLQQLRKRQPEKRFSVQQVLSIMGPIMSAVSYLHQQHPPIIHRDIKPSNIIVPTSGDEAVLVDFGIAKEFDPESTTAAIRHASRGYSAPEHYTAGTNTRTDIYSLGATIYALLTGVVPADAYYRTTQIGSRGIDPLEPIHRYAPNVPEHMAEAIYRAMAIDIDKRFPTVQEFWDVLTSDSPVPIMAASTVPPIELLSRAADLTTPSPAPAPFPSESTSVANPPGPARARPSLRRVGAWLLLLLALLIGISSAAVLLPALIGHHAGQANTTPTPTLKITRSPVATATHSSTPTPGSTTTPKSTPPTTTPGPGSGVPGLESQYNGQIHNTPANVNANMTLNAIQQNGRTVKGNFQVGSPLLGSGPFIGTVNSAGVIQFTVSSSQVREPLFFQGNILSDGSLAGTYCSLNTLRQCDYTNGYGTWHVSPSASGSGS